MKVGYVNATMFATCHVLLAGSFLDLHFDPENIGNIFFQSVGKLQPDPGLRRYFILTAVKTSNVMSVYF
jgi:hypothetical protein